MANNPITGGNTQGEYSFRCQDVMPNAGCNFEARGKSQDEVMRKAENHGRTAHGITNMDDQTRQQVQNNIRRAA